MTPWKKVIHTDGTTTWKVRYRYEGTQTSYSTSTEKNAEAFWRLMKREGVYAALLKFAPERLDAARPTAGSVTVEQWVADHIENLTGIKDSTRAKYLRILHNDIAPAFDGLQLSELRDVHVSAWVRNMEDEKASSKTIANKVALLRHALKKAARKELVPYNAAEDVKIKRTLRKKQPLFLTADEFGKVLDALDPRYHAFVEFLVASGCRWGEATSLQPRHINRQDSTVTIEQARSEDGNNGHEIGPTKTEASTRLINVDPDIIEALTFRDTDEWVFTDPDNGMWINPQKFWKYVWKPMLAKVDLPDTKKPRIHDLRHTCAAWMLTDEIPLYAVSKHLGHSTIKTTADVYGKLERKGYEKASAAVGVRLRNVRKSKMRVIQGDVG